MAYTAKVRTRAAWAVRVIPQVRQLYFHLMQSAQYFPAHKYGKAHIALVSCLFITLDFPPLKMIQSRILLVDDTPAIHADYEKILGKRENAEQDAAALFLGVDAPSEPSMPQFELTSANQGQEAVRLAEEAIREGEPFSLAFVDMRMPPGWDGLKTIEKLWRVDPDLQIVICSAFSDHSWHEIRQRLGETDKLLILKKPFDCVEVSQIAVALAEKWRLTLENRKAAEEKTNRLQNAEESLNKHSRHLAMASDLARLGYCSLDLVSDEFDACQRAQELLNANNGNIRSIDAFLAALHPKARVQFESAMAEATIREGTTSVECKTSIVLANGEQQRHLHLRFVSLDSEANEKTSLFGVIQDITEHENALGAVKHASLHDPLTKLPNRTKLLDHLEQALKLCKRHGTSAGVVLIDVDHFKRVNDTMGHPAGDYLLHEIASRLKNTTRDSDIVARLGGDEFAIVIADAAGPPQSQAMMERLLKSLNAPYQFEGKNILATVSAGIALAPDNGLEPEQLMKAADLALYRAKNEGRGDYRFFDDEMDRLMQQRHQLQVDLREANYEEEFFLLYQPIISLETGDKVGVEALMRWKHPKRGLISPQEFIPIAEEAGDIHQLGEWAIARACRDAALLPREMFVAVNVSVRQLQKGRLLSATKEALEDSGLPPHRLELEITETAILDPSETVCALISELKELGVRIVMDDFGTGHSSLSYLQSFPFAKIKLDRSFLQDSNCGSEGLAITRAVSGLGKSLNLQTCAEGVETQEQWDRVQQEGYTHAQGYLFGKPQGIEEHLE
ncbi:MAG: EAL domain-containing protein [Planctomycetota bacterium]